ncbi:MAG: asparaginase [Candidatus Dormibacteraeota bacterium]|nr:asparaginase [Candidatus Dormibacteraeota bacterium]
MTTSPALLATVWRGDVPEAAIRGHVAVVSAAGEVLAAAGDPHATITLRSCVKPLQALPFVRGAAQRIGAGDNHLAVACASHQGEDDHVATVRSLLALAGLSEDALACGAHVPFDETAARRLLASGLPPQRVHNNCSGKHAAMLATCAVAGWPLAGYTDPAHPCQRAVTAAMSTLMGLDLSSAPWGIDGCGLPTYGVSLATLARAFAAGQADPGFRRCQDAMAAHPHLVGGTGRFDTALLAESGALLTAKIGGAAVWAATLRPDGPAVALKLEAGAGEALPPVALAVLQRMGAFPEGLPSALEAFASPPLRNWEGAAVGGTRVSTDQLPAL